MCQKVILMSYKYNDDLMLSDISPDCRIATYIADKPKGLDDECRSGGAVCLIQDDDEFVVASFGHLLYCNNASSYQNIDKAWDMFDEDRRGLIADLKSYNEGIIPDSYRNFLGVIEQMKLLQKR